MSFSLRGENDGILNIELDQVVDGAVLDRNVKHDGNNEEVGHNGEEQDNQSSRNNSAQKDVETKVNT